MIKFKKQKKSKNERKISRKSTSPYRKFKGYSPTATTAPKIDFIPKFMNASHTNESMDIPLSKMGQFSRKMHIDQLNGIISPVSQEQNYTMQYTTKEPPTLKKIMMKPTSAKIKSKHKRGLSDGFMQNFIGVKPKIISGTTTSASRKKQRKKGKHYTQGNITPGESFVSTNLGTPSGHGKLNRLNFQPQMQ